MKNTFYETCNNRYIFIFHKNEFKRVAIEDIVMVEAARSYCSVYHILNTEDSMSGDMEQLTTQLNQKLKMGGWLENAAGGFGVDKDLLKEVKAFLSSKSILSHVSMVTMGVIPSIKSNELEKTVKTVKKVENPSAHSFDIDFDPSSETVTSSSGVAKRNALIVKLQNARIDNVLNAIGKITGHWIWVR